MYVVGDAYYGKVDAVPGLFFVKTRFLHIYWVPVVPRESYVFLDEKTFGGTNPGLRIPLRWKSVWVAWSRTALGLGIPLFGAGVLAPLIPQRQAVHTWGTVATSCALALICAWLYRLTYRCGPACLSRALELGELLGLSAEEIESRLERDNPEDLRRRGEDRAIP